MFLNLQFEKVCLEADGPLALSSLRQAGEGDGEGKGRLSTIETEASRCCASPWQAAACLSSSPPSPFSRREVVVAF